MLHQNTERRGVAGLPGHQRRRPVSAFMQWGGLILLVSLGQIVVATVLMAVYSWRLTLLVLGCFLPLFLAASAGQQAAGRRYGAVRERVGDMLGGDHRVRRRRADRPRLRRRARTAGRIDAAVDRHHRRARRRRRSVVAAASSSTGELVAGLAIAAVVVVGVCSASAGDITPASCWRSCSSSRCSSRRCRSPPRCSTRRRTPLAGWRRVLAVLDTQADVADPARRGRPGAPLPPGPVGVALRAASASPTRGGPAGAATTSTSLPSRGAGGRRRRDRLGQDDVRQAAHPADGPRRRPGAARSDAAAGCRCARCLRLAAPRVVMVPQDGFLFDASVAENIRYGRPGATDDEVAAAFDRARPRPTGWRACPTAWTRRSASAASRCRRGSGSWWRWPAPTSPTPTCSCSTRRPPPSTRPPRCGSPGRWTGSPAAGPRVTIAHRLSTAERADEVVVVDAGRVVAARHPRRTGATPGALRRAARLVATVVGGGTRAGPLTRPGFPRHRESSALRTCPRTPPSP